MESRRRLVLLRNLGYSVKSIKERLLEEKIAISRNGIYKILRKYKLTGQIADHPKKRRGTKLSDEHLKYIDDVMADNDELTARQLRHMLTSQWPELSVSVRTVRRARWKLGWVATRPKYCQLVRELNQVKRLEWCQKQLAENEVFDNVIFTDECSVQLDRHGRLCFRKRNQPRKMKPRPKHPTKVHIWGGISKKGVTPLVIFQGTLTSTRYCRILQESLFPFLTEKFNSEDYRFQQDNDPKHTSRFTQGFFSDNNVNWWRTPPESPDLNPIENVWGSLKYYLRHQVKPTNQETLVKGISDYWQTLTPDSCTKYISHLKKVIPKVVSVMGAASGY